MFVKRFLTPSKGMGWMVVLDVLAGYFFPSHISVLGVFDLFVADMWVAGGAARRVEGKFKLQPAEFG